MTLYETENDTLVKWVEKIYTRCRESDLTCRIDWSHSYGWIESIEYFDIEDVDKVGIEECTISIEGLRAGGNSKWDPDCEMEEDYNFWDIPFELLLSREFQEQFEQEFQNRYLNYKSSG